MKKIVALFTLIALTLTLSATLLSCGMNDNTDNRKDIKIGYFAGTTGLGMVKMIHDADSKYIFSKYSGPDTIISDFAAGRIDIAALPTNAAPNVYNATEGNAQLLAINTLGVLYICTNGATINSISDLSGKSIYVPEVAPKKVLKYVLDQAGVTNYTLLDDYNLDTLPAAVASGRAPIALLPEPKVTVAHNLYKKAQTENGTNENNFKIALDISEEWSKVSSEPLVQGCVIVNREFAKKNPALVAAFLADYNASINYMKDPANLDLAAQMTADIGILPNLAVAKAAIPRSNITFMMGAEMKAAASGFFTAFGIASPADAFYYIPEN